MKKIALFTAFSLFLTAVAFSQDTLGVVPMRKTVDVSKLKNRANDHFMIQLGYAGWSGAPDSLNIGGLSKALNFYFMFDFPFKTNPKLSMAFGPGISSDQIMFKETYIDIAGTSSNLQFRDQSDTNHFKRTKLATTYAELPVEFRFTADPYNSDRSFKAAIGLRVGTMLTAHTKNKTLETSSGSTLRNYTMKESSKSYFNSTRLSATARIGWGHFSLFGAYQITNLFKDGVAAETHPYSIGLTLSGL